MGWIFAWLALTGAGTAWYGWILTILWAWFVVPTFRAPVLTLPVAIGLALIARLFGFSTSSTDEKKSQADRFSYVAVWMITMPAMSLGIGWLVHLWM